MKMSARVTLPKQEGFYEKEEKKKKEKRKDKKKKERRIDLDRNHPKWM